ncbi:hypothetical protein M8494_10260 [Serratia ureilytica]
MALTDAGHDLFQHRAGDAATAGGRHSPFWIGTAKPNQLIVNTTPAFARHWLTPRLGDFNRQHPQVDLWLFTSLNRRIWRRTSIDHGDPRRSQRAGGLHL